MPNVGDRVRMVGIMHDPDPLTIGEEGLVTRVNATAGQIFVQWDSGRNLILLEEDPYVVVHTG